MAIPDVTLNNGVDMPILGFGVYQVPPEDTERAVTDALEVGYRHIDTAAAYENEEAVGRALRSSGIPRHELFVTTKLWIQAPGEANARRAFERSLERLGLDHDQEVMRARGVQIESWGPFAEGRNNLFSDPTLTEVGAAHGKSVAQVVLRWLIQRDVVVIPKSVRRERMAENIDVFDFDLTDEDMARIATLDTGTSVFFDHRTAEMAAGFNGMREG